MTVVVLVLLAAPSGRASPDLWLPSAPAGAVTAAAGIASFGLVLALIPAVSHRDIDLPGFIRVDALSVVFLLATGFLYAASPCTRSATCAARASRVPRTGAIARQFYVGLNLFAWSMLVAPLMSNLALLWIAVEVTTVVSALLVAIEDTDGAVEAAWKYVLIASAGLGIALLATIFMYYAGRARARASPTT